MTVRSFLENLEIMNHKSEERFPDGSGGKDEYALIISVDGHGKLLNAKVKRISVAKGIMSIRATGERQG